MESIELISIRDSLLNIAAEFKQDRNDLYQKLLEICEEIDSLFYINDDYSWPMSINYVCMKFDLNRNTVHTHKRNYLIKGKDYFVDHWNTLYLERSGVIKILMHSKSEKGIKYLKKYGLILSPKEQHLYINTINYAIHGFDITKKEFKVETLGKDYKKIDLYLQNAKLAIECDEHDHYVQEDSDELSKRQEDINKELECRFLRFNPHEPGFNVGEVINVIYHYIFNKLINGKDPIDYYMEKRARRIRERKYPKLTKEELAEFD